MNLVDASIFASDAIGKLRPHCERIMIAGSVRRLKPEVKDIEIVAIPKQELVQADAQGSLLDEPEMIARPVRGFIDAVNSWPKIRGEATGKYTARDLGGINLDLFMATVDNWGYILAIRTGSAEYSHRVLASGWVRAGYSGREGMLTKNGEPVPVREEEDLFRLIGIPWIHPSDRT